MQSEGDDRAEEAINAALARPMTADFQDTPLREVRQAFRSQLGVAIWADEKVLNDARVTEDTQFTFAASGQSGRTVLRQMLAEKDLAWTISNGTEIITTADAAKTWTTVRVYPVADLTLGTLPDGNYSYDFDSLIELIRSTVSPQSWDSNGGAGSIYPYAESGAIVVDQTREIQEQIALLLDRLRQVRHAQGLEGESLAIRRELARQQLNDGGAFDDASSDGHIALRASSETDVPQKVIWSTANPSLNQPARWPMPRVYH